MTTDITRFELDVVFRTDFLTFAERCFHELNPGTPFIYGQYLELLAAKLEAVREGRIRRLIINIPPRYLKSLLGSVALPAWWLGHSPSAQIICASYGQELSEKLSRDCLKVMASAWYQSLFSTRLSKSRQAASEFATVQGGCRLATSVGGVLTGRGGEVLIVDDPLKPDEALSATQRNAVNAWAINTLLSRLNDKNSGCIVVIMQRLHEDDLTGYFIRKGGWKVLSLPAIAEEEEDYAFETKLLGPSRFRRLTGEALHPEREPLAVLHQMRADIGEYNFAGQYQQSPAPLDGGMIKRNWLRRYGPGDAPPQFDLIFQSWDTANKPTELSDFSVCTTWGAKDRHLYLLNVWRKKVNYPDLKRAVLEQAELFRATVIVVEDKASGTQLIQEMVADGRHKIKFYKPKGDKVMRLHAQTGLIENGFVHLPLEAPWLDDLIHELLTFPNGRFDDQVDSLAQALDWFGSRPRDLGILTYYRELAAEERQRLAQDFN